MEAKLNQCIICKSKKNLKMHFTENDKKLYFLCGFCSIVDNKLNAEIKKIKKE